MPLRRLQVIIAGAGENLKRWGRRKRLGGEDEWPAGRCTHPPVALALPLPASLPSPLHSLRHTSLPQVARRTSPAWSQP